MSDLAIKVDAVSKMYRIFDKPEDRLKDGLLWRWGKRYGREFWALKDISFEVKKGESVGIIGRNGSGKSTLLQIIAGTLQPTSGSVQVNGRVAALLELGSGFNPDYTGRENVYMNAAILGLTKEETDAKFDAIASFADIGQFLDQPVKTYSSGMVVRVAFSVQTMIEPDILIVDEALSVGDALFQKRCFQKLEKLLSTGTTLLFVSHDQETVRTLTSRAVLLRHGAMAASGSSAEVVLEYRRQLNVEESDYFMSLRPHTPAKQTHSIHAISQSREQPKGALVIADRLSFGDGAALVLSTATLDENYCIKTLFYPTDLLRIKVSCQIHMDFTHLNVNIRIRNKEGVKVYSWGTLNQDIARKAGRLPQGDIFWERHFKAGEIFSVFFETTCGIGPNFYEIQSSICEENDFYQKAQRTLHWVDEAAFFTVGMIGTDYMFGGVADMRMRAVFESESSVLR